MSETGDRGLKFPAVGLSDTFQIIEIVPGQVTSIPSLGRRRERAKQLMASASRARDSNEDANECYMRQREGGRGRMEDDQKLGNDL